VAKCDYYGIDKKFVEKIEVGDIIFITSTMYDAAWQNVRKDSWEILITNKGISKTLGSAKRVNEILNRITEFEQIGLV
jgi:ASC-1-like (ASCH) protein